jgi:hypothetical protein
MMAVFAKHVLRRGVRVALLPIECGAAASRLFGPSARRLSGTALTPHRTVFSSSRVMLAPEFSALENAVSNQAVKHTIKFVSDEVQKWWVDSGAAARRQFVSARCTVPEVTELVAATYVERPALVQRIKTHVTMDYSVTYLNVIGGRGGGKSCVVMETLRERDGVVYVELDEQFQTINAVLKKKLGIEDGDKFTNEDIFASFRGEQLPILVVEIDSFSDGDTVKKQSQKLKDLCGKRLVHGILVLSDAGAAFKLNPDPFRQDFLWVGDFTRDEALAFLDKRGALPTDGEPADGPNSKLRRRLLDEAGANPQFLLRTTEMAKVAAVKAAALLPAGTSEADKTEAWRAAERGAIDEFIRKQLEAARQEVRLSLVQVPETKRIMRALIDSPASTVYPADLDTDAQEVMRQLKGKLYRAITYNRETMKFEFFTPPHELAAREWFEEEEEERKRQQFEEEEERKRQQFEEEEERKRQEEERKRQQFFGLRGFFMK